MKYNLYKLFHITGIVTWLGPATGGFLLIVLSRLSNQSEIEIWLRQEYLSLVYIEAAGLIMTMLSGAGMLLASTETLLRKSWLKVKGYIVMSIFLPLEMVQLYLYHGPLRKAFASGEGVGEAIALFDRFSVIALILLAVTVPVVLVMGIFKPDLSRKSKADSKITH